MPREVAQSLVGLGFPGLVEHCWSQIDADRVPDDPSKGASQQAGSAGHVERRLVRACFGHLYDPVQRLLIANGLSLRKRDSLARELVEDAGLVVHEGDFKLEFQI